MAGHIKKEFDMAKGYQKNQEHKDKVALLGKSLIRRCNKKCELCEAAQTSLRVVEVEPLPAAPHEDHAVMVCDSCREIMETGNVDANAVRFIESVIWSEVPAVQVAAVRICRILSRNGVDWATDLLDTVYLSPEVEQWLASD